MVVLLLFTAGIMGLLVLFETGAIAAHILYRQRQNVSVNNASYHQNLLTVWFTRAVLFAGMFIFAVLLTDSPTWDNYTPSIFLTAMSILYIGLRFIYSRVSDVKLFKLIPSKKKSSAAIQLGLTFPICSVPLLIVMVVIAITVDSIGWALTAGFLFATMFTLPMNLISRNGIDEIREKLLRYGSKINPYIITMLLLGAAFYLLIPSIDINPVSLKQILMSANWTSISVAFIAGFIFSFNPVSFASIPVMLAYVTKAHEQQRAVVMGAAFVVGTIVTHVVLGVAAALGGEWVQGIMGRYWGLFLGPVLIVMGLVWAGVLNISLRWFAVKGQKATGLWGAFLLGIPFSVAICPFCTPALMVVLTASAAIASVPFGFFLLFAFALGRSIPIMLGVLSMGWLESLQTLSQQQKVLEVIAGMVLIMTGLYMLNEYFFIVGY